MQVPVGWRAFASHSEELEFHCRLCGHRGRAVVRAVGTGEGSFFFGGLQRAHGRARGDARVRVNDKIHRTRCPRCGRRDPRVVWVFGTLHAACVLALAAAVLYMLCIPILAVGALFGWLVTKSIRAWWRELDDGIHWIS